MDFEVTSPQTAQELLEAIAANQEKNFRFGAGGTDLILELKRNPVKELLVLNLAQLDEPLFKSISETEASLKVGALTTAAELLDSALIQTHYPVLWDAAYNLASAQIREVATVGGNLCTASPSGDMACALVALKASCEILNTKGALRTVPIHDFFTGVRSTVLQKDEVLRSITIPLNSEKNLHSAFIKIGTRLSMECSVVSLAYHLQVTDTGTIEEAGIAIGSVSPTIQFTTAACDFLKGRSKLSESDETELAAKILEYASPISDVRASAWYREKVLYNISKTITRDL